MKTKINKANAWLHRNLFWVVLCFGFWISVLIGLVSYGISLSETTRTELNVKSDKALINDSMAVKQRGQILDSVSIQWRKSFKNLKYNGREKTGSY